MKLKNILLSSLALAFTYSCDTVDDANESLTADVTLTESFSTTITNPGTPNAFSTLTANEQGLYTSSYWNGATPTNVILGTGHIIQSISLSSFQTEDLKGILDNNEFLSGNIAISSSGSLTFSSSFNISVVMVFKDSGGTIQKSVQLLGDPSTANFTTDSSTDLNNISINITNSQIDYFFDSNHATVELYILTGTSSTDYNADFGINANDVITFKATINLRTNINTSKLEV